ncbi:hypothetical protein [Thermus hydrothermalis]|uniref:hypothetical protein n=1 Tax=Thermus hydrothermalis TaxID=2908148 RepID=UPI001FA96976|nr:hypothetical protein [Thermus hydrothermalis]
MPEWTPLDLWRANWVGLALWRVARGEADWVPATAHDAPRGWTGTPPSGGRVDLPAFLPVRVPALPEAGIPGHDLRLWREAYRGLVRGMSPGERMALEAFLGRGRHSRLCYWHAPSKTFRLNFPEDVVGVLVRVARLAEPLDKPQDMG